MYATRQLFTSEEAFVRLGQTGETGCLIIASPEETFRVFVEKSHVVQAAGLGVEGEKALAFALQLKLASHIWMPEVEAPSKPIKLSIPAYALKHSVARDIHMRDTGRVKLDVEKPKPVPKSAFFLIAEDRKSEKLELKTTSIVGRDPTCDIVLHSIQVSRRHCLFEIMPRGLYFRDLESTNGVMVNGIVAKEGFLNPGDEIHFGTYGLTVGKTE